MRYLDFIITKFSVQSILSDVEISFELIPIISGKVWSYHTSNDSRIPYSAYKIILFL